MAARQPRHVPAIKLPRLQHEDKRQPNSIAREYEMSVIRFPTRGLSPIDIRVANVVSAALNWEIEIARGPECDVFALIIPCSCENLVFSLTKERREYVLTKHWHYPEPPREVMRGSLEAALTALPQTLAA